ncbi:apolipoprotein N-acyltransferase [Sulfurimonas sp. C5]|uniref:apolipoprotein N-acyltransferase n=1 Tax=Sulfurimonas sp. C5 TaxID=3036947 RepID=UPI00245654E0|nr:apolipoprotein N-acyltransferase [Sulfurimonas sp. C5]MDH4944998.1 apolipoprotein N-acyltransferase [Sulfurimonas sp. C5]
MNEKRKDILFGLASAVFFSLFIYLSNFGLENKLLNTALGLIAVASILYIPKRSVLAAGFFIGVFWFYWIGFSFQYQGVGFMMPIVTLGFGLLYLLLFLPMYFTTNPFIRGAVLFALSFIEPFDWNWFKPELLFIDSFIGVYKYQFAIVIFALAAAIYAYRNYPKYKYYPLILLVFAINFGYPMQKELPLNMKLVQTDVKQEDKWKRDNLYPTVDMIFQEITKAKLEGYKVVVLPESVFPLFMNKSPKLIKQLQEISHSITIIAGALLVENGKHYNVTYLFDQGKYSVAKKVVLVPFGEYIPLPKFAKKFVNDTFFNGASDFVTADQPTDFEINKVKIRNAICYEATCDALYQGDVDFVVAISNNAWFTPSIEPTLQRLLMKYYARKYGVTIYHAANYRGSGVIK